MKKVLSLVTALVLFLCIGLSVYRSAGASSQTEVLKTGVLKAFNEVSFVVNEGGKTCNYTIEKGAKILYLGSQVVFTETAKKGLKLQYKVIYQNGKQTNKVNYIDIPPVGTEGLGLVGAELNEIRVSNTDVLSVPTTSVQVDERSSLLNVKYASTKENTQPDETNLYGYTDNKNVVIGDISLIVDSLKVVANGKEFKVVDATKDAAKEFDPKDPGDEVKLYLKGTTYYLQFEAPFTDKDISTQAEADEILQITYKKKTFNLTQIDLSGLIVNEDVYAELNGKEVTLAKALYRGNWAFVRTNLDMEIIYIDAYYNELPCETISIKGNTISVNVLRYGKAAYSETLTLSKSLTVMNSDGQPVDLSSLKAKDNIKVTVDPYDGYKVSVIQLSN